MKKCRIRHGWTLTIDGISCKSSPANPRFIRSLTCANCNIYPYILWYVHCSLYMQLMCSSRFLSEQSNYHMYVDDAVYIAPSTKLSSFIVECLLGKCTRS